MWHPCFKGLFAVKELPAGRSGLRYNYGDSRFTNLITINLPRNEQTQFARYVVSGVAAVGTDMITYHCFLPVLGPSPAKAVSFIAGTCVAYLLQKYWTFKMKEQCVREMSRFGLLYGTSLLLNVGVNKLVLLIPLFIPLFEAHRVGLAWLTATGFSTIYNYVGQKFWVFKGAKH